MQTDIDINSLLRFYLDAGVDETIGEEPVNRLSARAIKETAESADPRPAAAGAKIRKPEAARSTPLPSLAEGVRDAEEAARRCQSIAELRSALENFEHCALKKLATHTVFADGDPDASLMIIDRQPSGDEDRNGLPFSGAAGLLLDKMLAAIEFTRGDVYLASAIPWRPPGERALTDEERALCLPFVRRHIELAKPAYILACGEAAGYLLNERTGINRLRGRWKDLQIGPGRAKMLPIFHPAFLIDQPALKKYAWADLLNLKAAMKQEQ